ncbi:MAG: FAD-dependent monooxygenase [Pseudomonadota bacterium]
MSDSTAVFDVIVTGRGPAGMIAALAAHDADLKVALIGPPINENDERTTALLGPSIDAMEGLGLAENLAEIGTPLMTMRLLDGTRRLLRAPAIAFDAAEIGRTAFGLNCPNAKLNALLHGAVLDRPEIESVERLVAGYDLSGETIKVTVGDGTVLDTKTVIAADGRNSPARQAAGIDVRRWAYQQTAAVGHVRHVKSHDFISTEFHTETGPFTFVPLEDRDDRHRSSFVCALAPDDAERLGKMTLEEVSRFLEERSQFLLGALDLEEPVQLWPLESLVAKSFAAKGVFLIGETAHAFPPIGAQGLNLSIRDAREAASVIGEALKGAQDPRSMLIASRYSARRRADVWARTYGVDALNRSLLTNNPAVQLGRAVAMTAARMSPALKKGLMVAGLEPFSLGGSIGRMADAFRKRAA